MNHVFHLSLARKCGRGDVPNGHSAWLRCLDIRESRIWSSGCKCGGLCLGQPSHHGEVGVVLSSINIIPWHVEETSSSKCASKLPHQSECAEDASSSRLLFVGRHLNNKFPALTRVAKIDLHLNTSMAQTQPNQMQMLPLAAASSLATMTIR